MGGPIFWVLFVLVVVAGLACIVSFSLDKRRHRGEPTPAKDEREASSSAYLALRVYSGPRNSCNSCLHVFKPGDVVTIADDGKLAFCYTGGDGGCLFNFMLGLKPPRMLMGNPYVYKEHSKN